MAYKYFDNNPVRPNRGDCVIRAISKVMNQSWDRTYWDLCNYGFNLGDWGDSNKVWDSYSEPSGYSKMGGYNYMNGNNSSYMRGRSGGYMPMYNMRGRSGNDGYSREGNKEMMLDYLQNVADMAMDEKDRKAVERLMNQMSSQ